MSAEKSLRVGATEWAGTAKCMTNITAMTATTKRPCKFKEVRMNLEKVLQWIAVIGISIGAFFFRLTVLTKIWAYVFVPMGAPQITLLQAYGVVILVGLIGAKPEKSETEIDKLFHASLASIVQSLVSWGFAYWIFG